MFVPPAVIRLIGRIGVVAVAAVILALVGVQYARIIGRNVAMARDLHAAQRDVAALKVHRLEQDRRIRRLSDPRGAIPEIHDRLHLVGDKEAIIYLKRPPGVPPPQEPAAP